MAKRESLDQKLARIKGFAHEPLTDKIKQELSKALTEKRNILVARAAKVISICEIRSFSPELVKTFQRLMVEPVKSDPGCLAKNAIAEALYDFDYDQPDIFLKGIRHVQMEPVWGGSADTAAQLRGICGRALASMNYPDVIFELITLIMDSEVQPRRSAVNALAFLARRESELVLRMKVLAGDKDSEVVGMCFSGLMEIAPDKSLDFVAAYLSSRNYAIATDAAMALGESRTLAAFEILKKQYESSILPEDKKWLLLPIALVRRDEVFQYLTSVLRKESVEIAVETISALKIFMSNPEYFKIVNQIISTRNDPVLNKTWQSESQEFQ